MFEYKVQTYNQRAGNYTSECFAWYSVPACPQKFNE